jgi:hypothetical protein
VNYVDVLFSLAARLIRAATDRQVEVKEELLRHILDFTKEVSKEVIIEKATFRQLGSPMAEHAQQVRERLKQRMESINQRTEIEEWAWTSKLRT